MCPNALYRFPKAVILIDCVSVGRERVCGWKTIRPNFSLVDVSRMDKTELEKEGTESVVVVLVRAETVEGEEKLQW